LMANREYLAAIAKALCDAYYAFVATKQREHAVACGKQLLLAKQVVGHGHYIAWLKRYAPFGRVQATRYIALAQPGCYQMKNGKQPQWHAMKHLDETFGAL
jgi:hypothetical protein